MEKEVSQIIAKIFYLIHLCRKTEDPHMFSTGIEGH